MESTLVRTFYIFFRVTCILCNFKPFRSLIIHNLLLLWKIVDKKRYPVKSYVIKKLLIHIGFAQILRDMYVDNCLIKKKKKKKLTSWNLPVIFDLIYKFTSVNGKLSSCNLMQRNLRDRTKNHIFLSKVLGVESVTKIILLHNNCNFGVI